MLTITQLPVLTDNYIYLLECPVTDTIAIVDPAQAEPVIHALGGRTPNLILNTHHHADHVGGNLALKARYAELEIVGPAVDAARIPGITHPVQDGDTVQVGASVAHVLFVPAHTRGHIAFYFPAEEALFCGDTLFAGGCGRLFEGTPAQLFTSLQSLTALPPATKVYCAHEYTAENYRFAQQAFPHDAAIARRAAEVAKLRAGGHPTVPSTIAEELASNVFVRAPDVAALAALRHAKDQF